MKGLANNYDAYKKVCDCIASCENSLQLEGARRMAYLFKAMYVPDYERFFFRGDNLFIHSLRNELEIKSMKMNLPKTIYNKGSD